MSVNKTLSVLLGASILATAFAGAPVLADEESLTDALKNGKIIFDVRTRYETVTQDGFALDAKALTNRFRAGFKTATFNNLSFAIDLESIEGLKDDYNSTTNGNAMYPVVADPEGTELNQLKIAYTGLDKTTVTAGRQVIALDNHRFIGHVGFRQNQQTFDAVTLVNNSVKDLRVIYAYVDKVHRIFGNAHPAGNLESEAHAFNANYAGLPGGKATAYGYFVGIDAVPGLSSKTMGLRWDGNYKINDSYSFIYGAEFAQQSNYKTNPGDYDVNYLSMDAAVKTGGLLVKVALEQLGGDGSNSFKTPLATLHKFQGFADAFLNTPADGLNDYYAQVAYNKKIDASYLKAINVAVWYHDFKADNGSTNMGSEIDLSVTTVFDKGLSFNVKLADYKGKGFQSSRRKIWVTLGYKY